MSVLLRLAYDGTEFHGWASQSGAHDGRSLRTVQGEVEAALRGIYKQAVPIRAASRTDAGVHARGQLVAFEAPFPIPVSGLLRGLAARLPPDVSAVDGWEQVRADGQPMDPRHTNLGKRYVYRIRCNRFRDPLTLRYEWHLARPLALEPMQQAALSFVGEHDFTSFRGAFCQASTTIRRVSAVRVLRVTEQGNLGRADLGAPRRLASEAEGETLFGASDVITVEVEGRAFLKNMVRIMVGTLVEIGLGRRATSSVEELLRIADRRRAGMTVPPQGLLLHEVLWERSAKPPPDQIVEAI